MSARGTRLTWTNDCSMSAKHRHTRPTAQIVATALMTPLADSGAIIGGQGWHECWAGALWMRARGCGFRRDQGPQSQNSTGRPARFERGDALL